MSWEKLPAIEGGHGGCLNCGYQHDVFPMDAIIAVGFGAANVTCDGKLIYDEPHCKFDDDGMPIEGEEPPYWTGEDAEKAAVADPDHDWRISLFAPLSGREYQRQGDGHWVLVHRDMGFA